MDRGMSADQLHLSTLEIYSHLLDEFNPSLHRLVSLGNSYVQAFQGLAVKSEAYFNALSKMGERAFHTRSLGDVLIQIAESQRRLTSELESIFRRFQVEVLQEMDNNVRMDVDYIAGSKKHYELEVHSQAARERQLRRGPGQDSGEYQLFLRESNYDALQEEERRYRFLAEKHCGLIQSLTRLMTKTGGSLQQRADAWSEEASATRRQQDRMQPVELTRGREELGSVPSRAPSPENRSRLGSVSSVSDLQGGGGSGTVRPMRALVSHPVSGSDPTLLPFNKGEMISVMVQQPRNGWLYGRADGPSRQGWFPASYVGPMDDPPNAPMFRNSSTRTSSISSMSSLLSQSGSSTPSQGPPAPPPPPSGLMTNKQAMTQMQPASSSPPKPKSTAESKGLPSARPHPELFPKGTNPFATVKLKPTSTNDRSAPKLTR